MADAGDAAFESFQAGIADLRAALRKSTATNVGAKGTRDTAKSLVQTWFRSIRSQLETEGVDNALFADMDLAMQTLLNLANGTNRRLSYVKILGEANEHVRALELQRELGLGARGTAPESDGLVVSDTERRIIDTLNALVPSAGLSYQQALTDMNDASRLSYRGTANELRSALWDVLDRLAPDQDVMSAPGFKLEKNRERPTQKQKARFILKSRLGDTARRTPESTIELIEERVGSLARAVYDRSSVSAHVVTAAAEIRQLKMYVDTVLAELLEIHQR